MNVLLQLLVAVLWLYPDAAAGQFTAAPPTCPGGTISFRCIVGGDNTMQTTWRVGGRSECPLVHRGTTSLSCGPSNAFTAKSVTGFGTNTAPFLSSLSVTATPALNGTLIECFGPGRGGGDLGNRVGDSAIQVLGPPSLLNLSCVDLSDGAMSITVSWTLSDADFYLINITTNDPQPPYGGLLNITTPSVTQRELTGFQAGYEYTITVRGVNCGSQEGNDSEPLTITPQVPDAPASCVSTAVYNQSSQMLVAIDSTWDSVPIQDLGIACPAGSNGNITQYLINYQTRSDSSVNPEYVNASRCTNGKCNSTFQTFRNIPSSYDSVSVAAENVVGVGAARTCTAQPINTTNNLLIGAIVDVSSPINATLNCTFLFGFTGSARCRVHYGTDPTYTNLPYSDESAETGAAGMSVIVVLREQLNSSIVYYYTVSAVSAIGGDITVRVRAESFTTPVYNCILSRLLGWHIALITIGAIALIVGIVLTITGIVFSSKEVVKWTWWRVYFILICLITISGVLLLIGIPLWIALGVVTSNPTNQSCDLPRVKGGLIFQVVFGSISTGVVVMLVFAELWFLCRVAYDDRHKLASWKGRNGSGGDFTVCLRVVYRLVSGLSCVLYTISAALWIYVGATVAIPPSDIYTSHPLETLQSPLVSGGILLVIAIAIASLTIVFSTIFVLGQAKKNAGDHTEEELIQAKRNAGDHTEEEKLKWQQILYHSLMMISAIFCTIGVAVWITVGVVASSPPSDNICDICWRSSRDGLVSSGLVFSILAMIFPTAAMIWVLCSEEKPSGVDHVSDTQDTDHGRQKEHELKPNLGQGEKTTDVVEDASMIGNVAKQQPSQMKEEGE